MYILIPAFGRQRQVDLLEFEPRMIYRDCSSAAQARKKKHRLKTCPPHLKKKKKINKAIKQKRRG